MFLNNQRFNPCKGCPDKYPGCQDHCQKPVHIAWEREQEMIKANERAYQPPIWASGEPGGRRKW